MTIPRRTGIGHFLLSVAAVFLMVACITEDGRRETLLDIPIDKNNDSLLTFDTLIIKVYSKDSLFVQEVFHGHLTDPKKLMGIRLDSRVGKEFTVSILGYKAGKLGMHREFKILNLSPSGGKDLPVQITNRPPKLSPIADQKTKENKAVNFKVEATDPDQDSLTITVSSLPNGAEFTANNFNWTPKIGQAGNHTVKFKATDGRDSDSITIQIAVDVEIPPLLTLRIVSPSSDTLVNKTPITVRYKVNDILLQKDVALKDGQNRIYLDTMVLGVTAFDTLKIILDTLAPMAPKVNGPTPTNTRTPTWTWAGGGDGNGTFRYRLDSEDMAGGTILKDTLYSAPKDLEPGAHTLFIQERDEAGNWSWVARHAVVIDTTRPPPPIISVSPASPTNDTRPTWSWIVHGTDIADIYRFKLDDFDFRTGSTETKTPNYRPETKESLKEGAHTLYVQQRDSAGNWSEPASNKIFVDLTPPPAPRMLSIETETFNRQPTWKWNRSGSEGIGIFRHTLRFDSTETSPSNGSDTAFMPAQPLKGASRFEFSVQERDSAGNWSTASKQSIHIRGIIGYAAGWAGTILKTTDAGESWKELQSGTTEVLFDIQFLNDDSGFACAGNGVILKTTNAGFTWAKASTGTSDFLYSESFPNRRLGFAAGDNGTILKTQDGGQTWATTPKATSASLLAIHFPDTSVGYAAGSSNVVVKTVNSGATWELLNLGSVSIGYIRGIFFNSKDSGYIVGDGGAIARTSNGGATWAALDSRVATMLQPIHFVNKSTGFVAASGSILVTKDAGITWDSVHSGSPTIWDINFLNPQYGYAACSNGIILKSKNGGLEWESINTKTSKDLRAVFFP